MVRRDAYMRMPLFTGVCTALVTPFLDDQVNYPMMEQLLQRQMDAGISAVVICGTTGEAPTLSDDEKLKLFHRAKSFAGSDCKIIAGTGSNCTKHTLELSLRAQEVGVDGLLVVSPYYNKTNAQGLYAHYSTLSHTVNLPIIVYNVPSRTGLDIPVSVYSQLCQLPNIAGVKEAATDITKITKIRHACGKHMPIWTGNDEQITPVISLGGSGVISVLSNVAPLETRMLTEAALDGDFDTAAALQTELQPLVEALFSDVNPIPVKEAMKMIGYDCGFCRAPLGTMDETKKSKLKTLLG